MHDEGKDRAAIGATVDAVYDAFTKLKGPELCDQLTPAAQHAWMSVMEVPLVKGRTCAQQWIAVYRHVPLSMQPRAPAEVQNWNRGGITIDGDSAKVHFEDGAVWDLRRVAGRWRIEHLPILPRGWTDPSGHLTG